jgi:hypothetical protein
VEAVATAMAAPVIRDIAVVAWLLDMDLGCGFRAQR